VLYDLDFTYLLLDYGYSHLFNDLHYLLDLYNPLNNPFYDLRHFHNFLYNSRYDNYLFHYFFNLNNFGYLDHLLNDLINMDSDFFDLFHNSGNLDDLLDHHFYRNLLGDILYYRPWNLHQPLHLHQLFHYLLDFH